MSQTIADRVLTYLARVEDPPTASEIADAIGANSTAVSTALRMLANLGRVKPLGVAYSGARTWALTDEAHA